MTLEPTSALPPTISVVIPFFQRERGPLRRALQSIFSQEYSGAIHIVICDDSSPVPLACELDPLPEIPHRIAIHRIHRPNGGPAAARNSALDYCPSDTDLVAFLDSDDEWHPRHLSNAVETLACGFDTYFADHLQLDQTVGGFARAKRLNLADHSKLAAGDTLYSFDRDMLDQVMRGNIIGTSTVVYDFRKFGKMRFREEFTSAGEDYLFWMSLANAGARFCFSTLVEAKYGHGVNVYSGAGWGTEGHMLRIHNELRYRLVTEKSFDLNSAQLLYVREQVIKLRLAFARDLVHRIAHRKRIDRALVRRHFELDSMTFLYIPKVMLGILLRSRA